MIGVIVSFSSLFSDWENNLIKTMITNVRGIIANVQKLDFSTRVFLHLESS